jgi:uncharacterized protein YbcI
LSDSQPSTAATAAERGPQSVICAGISALVRERWGRGPSRSRAHWAGRDALVVMLEDAHTEAEQTLIDCGHADQVLAGRRLLGEISERDLRRIAQSATGRAVRAVLSQTSLEPPLSTHVFVFEPAARQPGSEERLGRNLQQALENTETARALLAEG